MPHSGVPLMESLDALVALQAEGKIRHLALSCVDARQVEAALARTPIVAVQNVFSAAGAGGMLARYSHAEVDAPEAVLDLCTARGIAYLPFFPLAGGNIATHKPALQAIAARHAASPSQIALAWLLVRSPVILPIPGTTSLAHLEENWDARRIALSPNEIAAISA
jgi:aryl-alcohol dehydrogenase-like predicted oxidoreductase